ncbi:unnamed protein product [Thlaspi arvense]|uniref:ETS domain-containing protein n=1 Tax=Thlaspi arvense TaxID=13288 RepID=A0AAU9TAU2_THLAR|nr:unnamed protein product [Thlaspi arvense]
MSEVLRRAKHALVSVKQYQSLLNHYAATQSIAKTKALHCHIITGGRISGHIVSTLSVTYALCGHIAYARKLFEEMPQSSLLSYNIVIRMYVRDGLYHDAIETFIRMVSEGVDCCPDSYTYPFVAKAAGELKSVNLGLAIHGRILRSSFGTDKYVQNALLAMYMSFGRVETARRVFDVMKNRDVISWNTMISGYCRNGYMNDALMIFDLMVTEVVDPDHATIVSLLPVCGHLKDLEMGRNVHKLVEEKRLGDKIEVKNALVNMYLKCGRMDEARFVFDRMERRDVITWTSMINGYTEDGDVKNALELCRMMQFQGVRPNAVTIASLVSACGDALKLSDGKCLHGWAIRQKVCSTVTIETSLISMYAKCNRIDLCFKVFSGASRNQTGPWSAVISGCVQNEHMKDALEMFKSMRREDVEPNIATLNSLLPAYAALADLRQAMDIHCYLTKTGFMSSLDAATGLVHVYSKMVQSFQPGSNSFFIRLYQIVDDPSLDSIVSWSDTNDSFVLWDLGGFRTRILPKSAEFGRNISEFVRELRYQGFKQIGRSEFGRRDFVKSKLLKKKVESFDAKRQAKKAKAKAKKARKQVENLFQNLQI